MLVQSGEKLALFQNMGNEEYRKIAFGSPDIGEYLQSTGNPSGRME